MQKGSRIPNDFFLQVLEKKLRKNKDSGKPLDAVLNCPSMRGLHRKVTESSLVVSEKTLLTARQLDNLDLVLRDMEVDSKVLSTELTKLEGFSGRIADDIRALVLSLQDLRQPEVIE